MSTLLAIEQIEVGYGDLTAVRDVSLEVKGGEAVALVGSNGAGKTTALRAVSGLLPLRRGRILFEGERIDRLPSARIAARGIAHVPEGRQLFPTMTVRENVELGAIASASARSRRPETLAWVFQLFPRLRERADQLAGTLSGGEQQMCAIARGLMARPRLLMLDEPSLGLAPIVVRSIFETLVRVNRDGTALLLVEQNVPRALGLTQRAYVLESGAVALAGWSTQILADPHVRRVYLGL